MLRRIVETEACMNSMSFTYNVILVYLPVAWYSETVTVTGAVRGKCSCANDSYSSVSNEYYSSVLRLLDTAATVQVYQAKAKPKF